MLLIGMFDSPFVRRVAITLKLIGQPFEHANWSIGRDFDRIREYNPLGRVPTLLTDEGETLMESSAILDYLDERAGPENALLPRAVVMVGSRISCIEQLLAPCSALHPSTLGVACSMCARSPLTPSLSPERRG